MPYQGEPRLFVRDDDVGPLTDALRYFVETFVRLKVPVSYQIIPSQLTEECARWLRARWLEYPELIEFGQHGLEHQMLVRGRRLLREFGPERSLSDQKKIVELGRRRLKEMMGEDVPIRVFTPPQHKYDANTIRAVAAAGHRIFSAAAYPSRYHQLAYRIGRALGWSSIKHHGISRHLEMRPEAALYEISVAVVVDDGRSIRTRSERLSKAVALSAAHSDVVGMMFHHDVYIDQLQELDAIASALALFGSHRYSLLSRLAP